MLAWLATSIVLQKRNVRKFKLYLNEDVLIKIQILKTYLLLPIFRGITLSLEGN